jgi:hypothetical protein
MLAVVRPDAWNLPLLVHVAGAMLLVGFVAVAVTSFVRAARGGEAGGTAVLTRVGFRALVLGAIPAYIVMRGGAEWIASEEDLVDPTWIGIGYSVSDGGLLVLLITAAVAQRAARRTRDGGAASRAAPALAAFLLVAFTVAVWAMTAKPG